jgi:hypothetical protein
MNRLTSDNHGTSANAALLAGCTSVGQVTA